MTAQRQGMMLELTTLVAAQIVLMGVLSLNRHSRDYLMGLVSLKSNIQHISSIWPYERDIKK
jgi:hypothetical protein